MIKTVSIKVQKILSFIPIINFLVGHIWIYNYMVAVRDLKILGKSLLIIFSVGIPLGLAEMFLLRHFSEQTAIASIVWLLGTYAIPFCIARSLIRLQEGIFL